MADAGRTPSSKLVDLCRTIDTDATDVTQHALPSTNKPSRFNEIGEFHIPFRLWHPECNRTV
jgi:hypothetical protein